MKDGKEWHWCMKDHYHDGAVKNGMYAPHKTSEHDAWRKAHDEKQGRKHNSYKKDDATPSTAPSADAKKLALSESLRTALCTQAGLSTQEAARLWNDACKDSGNE